MQNATIAIWTIEMVVLAAIYLAMPSLSRLDIFFSIVVKPDFRKTRAAGAIISGYRWRVLAASVVGLAIAVAGRGNATAGGAAFVILVGGCIAALIRARNQVRVFAANPSPVREARLSQPHPILPVVLIVAIPVLILFALVAWANLNLTSMPEPFPIHWGVTGEANGWVPRTRFNVNTFFAVMILVCALIGTIAAAIALDVRRIRINGRSALGERLFWAGTILLLVAFEYLSTGIAMLPLGLPGGPIVIGLLLIGVAGTVSLIVAGQGGSHLAKDEIVEPIGDRTPDENWKWGIFYLNRDDPALIVEKRFGIGYTLNFGHRGSWIIIGAICVVLLVVGALPARQLFGAKAASAVGGRLGDQLLSDLKDSDFVDAERDFSSVMKEKLPAEDLAKVWMETTRQLGDLRSWQPTNSENQGGLEARNYEASFTHGHMRVLVGVDPVNAQIVGLWFLGPKGS